MDDVTLRTNVLPGDVDAIVRLHGDVYADEQGFDGSFEAYVAGPLSEFVERASGDERLWVAERDGRLVGCIAIVAVSDNVAQLRWFLVEPGARGAGLGRRLMQEAVAFCRDRGYATICLWTVSALTRAAKLYRAFGFCKVEEQPRHLWGVEVVEEKYELGLS